MYISRSLNYLLMPLPFFIFLFSLYCVILFDCRKLVKTQKLSSRKKWQPPPKPPNAELSHVTHLTWWPFRFSLKMHHMGQHGDCPWVSTGNSNREASSVRISCIPKQTPKSSCVNRDSTWFNPQGCRLIALCTQRAGWPRTAAGAPAIT